MTQQEWDSLVRKRRPELFPSWQHYTGWAWYYTGWDWPEMTKAEKEWIAQSTEEQVVAHFTAKRLGKP